MPQFLADQLTLFKPGGELCLTQYYFPLSGFSDPPPALNYAEAKFNALYSRGFPRS